MNRLPLSTNRYGRWQSHAVPCWVREFDDAEAEMLLATCNTQSELTPLTRGLQALRSQMEVRAYANHGRATEQSRSLDHDCLVRHCIETAL